MRLEHWSLRLRMFLFFAFLASSAVAAICLGLALGYKKLGDPEALDGFVFAGIIAGFGILGVSAWIWILFDEHIAKPIGALSGALLAATHTEQDDMPAKTGARYLGDLGLAAQTASDELTRTREALAQTVALETTQLIETTEKLGALAAEIPFGVLLVSGMHRVVFYNGAARAMCSADHTLGLGHSLFDTIDRTAILSAYARLCAGDGGIGHVISTTVSLSNGTEFLSARLRLVHAPNDIDALPAYVLTLDDLAQDHHLQQARLDLGALAVHQFAQMGATLQTAQMARQYLGDTAESRALDRACDDALAQAALDASTLLKQYRDLGDDCETAALMKVTGQDICNAITARLKDNGITIIASESTPLFFHVDPDKLIALISYLALQLSRDGAKALSLLISTEDTGVIIALGWMGEILYFDRLETWLCQPTKMLDPDITGRAYLNDMNTDLWPEFGIGSRRVLKLPIPQASVKTGSSGGLAYDFDLLTQKTADNAATTPLKHLTYVVFDTETTGLLPDDGDEICQIAATRIVNGQIVPDEQLNTLVDPERTIPVAATKIHHITNDMIQGQPKIGLAGRALHSFARGSVLVAHNAPFDMAFLHRHADRIGAPFDHPVIDTVLLSAVVFGQSASHSLDDICQRLNVIIPPEQRHTALGDTLATAKVFLKMLSMAEAKGLTTFEALLTEMKRHKRLLQDLNTAPLPK
ncbi:MULTISPECIES: 3'-5' exonuclease [Pacificibacter]|uniref:3'-5' exonuclease n=1 Tax=Pacificibacter TaxID=1042323 RepID=UPI002090EA85|nr:MULTISPECIES: 3'-5' exonuclease [Pacificibacter]MDO6616125.1 3'-5' exonuclease [Pacificibacter sp. 1_MG-2023]